MCGVQTGLIGISVCEDSSVFIIPPNFLSCLAKLEDMIPVEMVPAVQHAMDCHPTSEKILTQGCLALGNIGRTGE